MPEQSKQDLLLPHGPRHLRGVKIALTNYKAMGATNILSLSFCVNNTNGNAGTPYPGVAWAQPPARLIHLHIPMAPYTRALEIV